MKYTAEQYLERIENKRLNSTPLYSKKEMIDFAEKYAKQCDIHGVVKSLPTEECAREWYREGIDEELFWQAKPDWDNDQIFTEVYKALKYFINRWQQQAMFYNFIV